jgi:hypothetical protein
MKRSVVASIASLSLLLGVWSLAAGTHDDMRTLSDRECTRITGGDCQGITPAPNCAEKSTKSGMPDNCPGGTLQTLCPDCPGNVSKLFNTDCKTPCSANCGTKSTAYNDCDGEKHNF